MGAIRLSALVILVHTSLAINTLYSTEKYRSSFQVILTLEVFLTRNSEVFFSSTGQRAMAASSEAPSIDFTPDSSKQLEMAIRAVQQGLRSVEVVYASHPRWPLPRRILPNPSTTPSSNTNSITGSGKLFFQVQVGSVDHT